MSTTPSAARASVFGAAFLFATGGAAIKGTTLSSVQVAGFRSGIAAIAMLLLLPTARSGLRRDVVPGALAYAAALITFVAATKLTTSGAAIFLQATSPLWVLVLSPLLLGERFERRELPYLAVAALALVLVFVGSQDALATAPQPQLGNAIALVSGLAFALLLVSFRKLARVDPLNDRSVPAAMLGNLLAFAFCLPFALPVQGASARDALVIGYLGVVQVGLAYFLLGRGLRVLPALEASVLLLIEPVLNPVWTWLIHGERPSALAACGGAVLIAVLAVRARPR